MPANRVSQILAGRRAVTADTALRLARWFGTSAELWMNLQQTYELDLARQRVGEAIGRLPDPPGDRQRPSLRKIVGVDRDRDELRPGQALVGRANWSS